MRELEKQPDDDGLVHCAAPGCKVATERQNGQIVPSGWIGVIEGLGGYQTRTTPFHSRACLVAWVKEQVRR